MEIISRKQYADKVDSWIGKSQVIVITGQRRVGKSFVLKDFIERHKNETAANIIYIDKEKRDFAFIKNGEQLGEYIDSHFIKGRHNYILVDEIQDIEGWERAIRSFRTEENTDIIITGSNSKMLSSELSTLLSGRYEEIHIQPLSYLEFLQFHSLDDNDESLMKYLEYGGLPGLSVIGLDDEEHVWEYLRSIFNTVLLKDVIERYQIRNVTFMNNLLVFWADTIGKVNSATSISKYMKSQKQDVSTNVILDYTGYFEEAYLLKGVKRYDIHGKKIFETNQKVYFGDVGLRNFIVGSNRETDIEKVLENVIYQHLVRLGYQVYIGELRVGEIDFVCRKTNELKYIQVAYLLKDEETIKREFGRLQDIQDNYPKYVISLTPFVKNRDYNGVTHLGLREFLKKGL
jgi:hypothetical protein